jgi:deferrochelatase/peroxidase EfeB
LSQACFLLLRVSDTAAALDWIRTAPVSNSELLAAPPETALQLAFTSAGLRALGVADAIISGFSEEFISGMAGDVNRSRRLGDINGNSPHCWRWGGPAAGEPHVLLMLYAGAGKLDRWRTQLEGTAFSRAFELLAELPTPSSTSREPFGFADGISQPEVDWWGQTTGRSRSRPRYSHSMALGELALGHLNEYGLYTDRPLVPADESSQYLPAARDHRGMRDLGCNGTYLVLRQLAQDVRGFWRYLDSVARSDPQRREQLAAAMVGRNRNGEPLADASGLNGFDFDGDPGGERCPLGAHIRRANPRTGDFPPEVSGPVSRLLASLGFARRDHHDDLVASTRFHRIVRRGRAYGPELTPEQALMDTAEEAESGLHFVCLGANIARQFEFVQSAWIMSGKFAGLRAEADPLLGNRNPLPGGWSSNHFSLPQNNSPASSLAQIPPFVTVIGGAYFFLPGIRGLRYLVEAGG